MSADLSLEEFFSFYALIDNIKDEALAPIRKRINECEEALSEAWGAAFDFLNEKRDELDGWGNK